MGFAIALKHAGFTLLTVRHDVLIPNAYWLSGRNAMDAILGRRQGDARHCRMLRH